MNLKNLKPIDFRKKVNEIKNRLDKGENYEMLKKELEPFLDEMNRRGEKIAKKNRRKFYKFTFIGMVR